MKNIKFLIYSAIVTLFFFGCDVESAKQDAEPIAGTDNYPIPSFTITTGPTTINEFDEPEFTYTVTLDRATKQNIDFSFVQTGGTATLHDDYDVVNATIPAYETTATMTVMIHNDTEVEGDETLSLTIESGPSLANKYLVSPSASYPTLDLTIIDWEFCIFTLETSDTYGDGWNGGYIEFIMDGVSSEYSADDDVADVYEIAVTDGADFSFTYVSGGGGFCGGPGYECENYFKLTTPDGTVYEEGSTDYSAAPTEGVIVAGTNNCP